MKSIFKIIPQIALIMLFSGSVNATASSMTNENDRILEAMQLYVEASSMDHGSQQQNDLLVQSETILLDVIEKNPESLDAHRKLMGVYLQMRNYRKGILTLQTAITLSPEDPKLFIALAILYDHQGAYEYARGVLNEALALDPENTIARDFKASIQQKIDQQNVAMEATPAPHEMDKPHSMEKRLSK